ncbi:hypothetical protein [Pseudomonas sp. KU43P]|uniref:hypothetical protein n=1 Tax=Pseudomonas sp. KU43P TaxID=2487887 RepID=UPI0012A83F36|nr:hypothetical protein [Pseudomonas sp. KU43P]BBH44773.1 hypothetical protein KU43P_12500 [Pseudomonas sp. KU43P]
MANTQVLTLGLGVTVINPLGQAIDLLRRDVERLRRQVDDTRLGRLVGEVIRLGLELGKVRQVERQLALDQEQQHEEQVARLGDEIDAVERLRRHYLLLDQVIAGMTRLQPLPGQWAINVLQPPPYAATDAATPKPQAAEQPTSVTNVNANVPLARGVAAAAGMGLAALAGRYGAREIIRRQPRDTQRRIARGARKEWQENRVDAIGKVGKALISGEDGKEKAQGVGAAVGEIGGRVLGAVLPLLSKSKSARKHGAKLGGYLGEAVGELAGGKLYAWATQETDAEIGAPDAVASAVTGEQAGKRPEAPAGRAVAMASGLLAVAGYAAYNRRRRLPADTRQRIARVTRKEWRDNRMDTAGKIGQALITSEDGEERASGVGAAVGEMGGRLLGAALPHLTRNRWGRTHGAKVGGYLGEALGALAGSGLFNWAVQASNTQGEALSAVDEAAAPPPGEQAPTAQKPEIPAAPLVAMAGAGLRMPAAAKLLKRVPGAALLDATSQIVHTYNSDGTPAQKLEGYGTAVGGLGGSLAGAAAGAAIGSVVPGFGTLIGALIGGAVGGMGGEGVGGWLGRAVASVTQDAEPAAGKSAAKSPGQASPAQGLEDVSPPRPAASVQCSRSASQAEAPPVINQQFTFTANMPVTFNNSLNDPTTRQQLEAITRRVLDDLMRQARSVQMADQPQP